MIQVQDKQVKNIYVADKKVTQVWVQEPNEGLKMVYPTIKFGSVMLDGTWKNTSKISVKIGSKNISQGTIIGFNSLITITYTRDDGYYATLSAKLGVNGTYTNYIYKGQSVNFRLNNWSYLTKIDDANYVLDIYVKENTDTVNVSFSPSSALYSMNQPGVGNIANGGKACVGVNINTYINYKVGNQWLQSFESLGGRNSNVYYPASGQYNYNFNFKLVTGNVTVNCTYVTPKITWSSTAVEQVIDPDGNIISSGSSYTPGGTFQVRVKGTVNDKNLLHANLSGNKLDAQDRNFSEVINGTTDLYFYTGHVSENAIIKCTYGNLGYKTGTNSAGSSSSNSVLSSRSITLLSSIPFEGQTINISYEFTPCTSSGGKGNLQSGSTTITMPTSSGKYNSKTILTNSGTLVAKAGSSSIMFTSGSVLFEYSTKSTSGLGTIGMSYLKGTASIGSSDTVTY